MNIQNKNEGLTPSREENLVISKISLVIKVKEKSFLHIGAAPSPLSEKKGAVFKVDQTPVIPATSFKGALRYKLEQLFIKNQDEFLKKFHPGKPDSLKPCIPAPNPTIQERCLFGYRKSACNVQVSDSGSQEGELGVCPVCYFLGCTGLMGFLIIPNFYPEEGDWIIDQTNIRIDRKTNTAASKAKVDGEQVKPGTKFKGEIEIILKTPQGFEFGQPRKLAIETKQGSRIIDNKLAIETKQKSRIIDKWLESWDESAPDRKNILVNDILIPAIKDIQLLGGQKSRGAGKVEVSADWHHSG
ncbi:MAG: RAMP superfamily CRISPR-associated protein [candidate division WOR-3 bacterium]|nr:RAMP superfamily CRISPR-associated protein [candidate division WOR-3 bacterium]